MMFWSTAGPATMLSNLGVDKFAADTSAADITANHHLTSASGIITRNSAQVYGWDLGVSIEPDGAMSVQESRRFMD